MNLLDNPFHFLGANACDGRRRLLELAEQSALAADPERATKARADLTNPRNRIVPEVAWLPGTPPEAVAAVVRSLKQGMPELPRDGSVTTLGAANVAASALALGNSTLSVEEAAKRIEFLAVAHDETDQNAVLNLINRDRSVAGFPEISDLPLFQQAMAERRDYYREAIWLTLDRMPTRDIVAAITRVVEKTSGRGMKHAPILVDQVVDAFEGEARRFLEQEAANARALTGSITRAAGAGAARERLEPLFAALEKVVKNWDSVAQPIQLSAMSRGLDHVPSSRLANELRDTAVDLNNEHGLLWAAQRLIGLVRDVFAEVPRIVELIQKDLDALERLAGQASRGRSS